MDSGAFDYNQLWMTSSLRGICILDITVELGSAGYHSGEVGGIVPETFRILRTLIDRLDDSKTGQVCDELRVNPVPDWKMEEAKFMADLAGPEMHNKYGIVEGGKYCNQDDRVKMYLGNVWEPNLSITGAEASSSLNILLSFSLFNDISYFDFSIKFSNGNSLFDSHLGKLNDKFIKLFSLFLFEIF